MVGVCFRALERHCITAEPVRGLGNVDSASAFQPKPDFFDLAAVTVTAKDGSRKPVDPWKAEFRTDAPWTYLQGLKLLLLAIAKAGALATKPARIHSAVFPTRLNGEHEGPNVYVQDVIDYLAKLENFVITCSRRNPQPSKFCSEDLVDPAQPRRDYAEEMVRHVPEERTSGYIVLPMHRVRQTISRPPNSAHRAGR